jgi:hypothetical protein
MRSKLMTFLSKEALYGLGELRDKFLAVHGKTRGYEEEAYNTSYRSSWEGITSEKGLRKVKKRSQYVTISPRNC